MRTTPIGQKWFIEFIDLDGKKSGGITNHYKCLPRIISQILHLGGSEIVIRDETIYKDESHEYQGKNNVVELQSKR